MEETTMKTNIIRTTALALALACAIPATSHAGDIVPGPTKDNALAFGIGAVTTLALDKVLSHNMNANVRTALIFAGATMANGIVEAEKAAYQGRAFDNTQLGYALGGTFLAYQFHF
jgi:hypothetical protein